MAMTWSLSDPLERWKLTLVTLNEAEASRTEEPPETSVPLLGMSTVVSGGALSTLTVIGALDTGPTARVRVHTLVPIGKFDPEDSEHVGITLCRLAPLGSSNDP
jgi:hypothetical protein